MAERITGILGADGYPLVVDNPIADSGQLAERLLGCVEKESSVRIKTPAEGLRHPGVWKCLHFICHNVGKTPLEILNADHSVDKRHFAADLVGDEPNKIHSAYSWKYITTQHAAYWGDSCSYIVRDRESARPLAIIPFTPQNFAIGRTFDEKSKGRMFYSFFARGKWHHGIPSDDVYHLIGWTHDGISGISFWNHHGQTLGLGVTAQNFAATYYSGGANPLAVVKKPVGLPKDPEHPLHKGFVDSFKEVAGSFGRKYRVMLLDNTADYEPVNGNAQESQMHEAREVSLREVANLFGLPPFTVGLDQNGPYKSNSEKVTQEIQALNHWFCLHEAESRKKLLTERQKKGTSKGRKSFRFNRDALFDQESLINVEKEKVGAGLSTVNESRGRLGLPPVENGDCLLIGGNKITLEQLCDREPGPIPGVGRREDESPSDETEEASRKANHFLGRAIDRATKKEDPAGAFSEKVPKLTELLNQLIGPEETAKRIQQARESFNATL